MSRSGGSETLLGNLKQWLDVSFGVRGARNAASWLVAGGIAYYFIWQPEQRRRAEIERERLLAKERAIAAGVHAIDRARPIPDPQDRGLVKGARGGTSGGGGGSDSSGGAGAGSGETGSASPSGGR